jgi:hypothetical protein
MEQTEFVCTIGRADIARRAAQLDALVPQVLGRGREERTLAVEVPASAEEGGAGLHRRGVEVLPVLFVSDRPHRDGRTAQRRHAARR